MLRTIIALSVCSLVACDRSKVPTASKSSSPAPAATASGTQTSTVKPTASARTKVKTGSIKLVKPVLPSLVRKKAAPSQTGPDDGRTIARNLMETMIRRDIDSARSLFPPRAFLDLHLGKAECKTFKETVAANRDALYDFSRAWVRSSIIKLLHPKDWKERLKNKREVRVKDEIATSLNLTLSKVEFVDKTASSLGSSIDSCTGLKGSEIRRYRAIYDATILNGQGTLTLDAEVMNVAGKGWLVVGYRHE